MPSSAEAVHHIESAFARGVGGGSRKGDDAERLPHFRNRNVSRDPHGKNLNPETRTGVCEGSGVACTSEDGHIHTDSFEFVGDLPRYSFHAAGGEREAFDYDGDTEGRAQGGILNGELWWIVLLWAGIRFTDSVPSARL